MAAESNVITVTLDDEQLAAAIAARAIAGSAGSLSRDGVVLHYTVEKTDAGNVVTTTVLEKPFYVSMAEVETYVTELLIPPAPAAPEGPPTTTPTETGALNMPMNNSTDSIVALASASTTAIDGSILQIDSECMTVTDATDLNNLQVARAASGTAVAAHEIGASVTIWGSTTVGTQARAPRKSRAGR